MLNRIVSNLRYLIILLIPVLLFTCKEYRISGDYKIKCINELEQGSINELSFITFSEDSFELKNIPDAYYDPWGPRKLKYNLIKNGIEVYNGDKVEIIDYRLNNDLLFLKEKSGPEIALTKVNMDLNHDDISMSYDIGNKIFSSESHKWIFSNDNRLKVESIIRSQNYSRSSYQNAQFYSIHNFGDQVYLNVHGNENPSYVVIDINDNLIELKELNCSEKAVVLNYVKDTLISPFLKLEYQDFTEQSSGFKVYSNYSMETLWRLVLYRNGIFKFQPEGHFNGGQIYMGTYKENLSVIELNYFSDKIGTLEDLGITIFHVINNDELITNKGRYYTSGKYPDQKNNDKSDLLYDGLSKWKLSQKHIVVDESKDYLTCEIIDVNPMRVGFFIVNKDSKEKEVLETMNLTDLEIMINPN